MGWIVPLLLFIGIYATAAEETHPSWNYDKHGGPAHWGTMYPNECSSDKPRQSPVAIDPAYVNYLEEELDEIDVISDTQKAHEMTLQNNGHSAKVNINGDVRISGGNLGEDAFRIVQMHFHWGSDNSKGSEHTVGGRSYPLELHMVSYDTERYASLQEALHGFNSLAVLGTLFEIDSKDNQELEPIIDHLQDIKKPGGAAVPIQWIDVQSLLPEDRNQFYRYDGSLTTPQCLENVIWTVFANTQKISSGQLAKFRELLQIGDNGDEIPMVDNFRPPQPLHLRKVFSSFIPEELREREEKERAENGAIPTTLSLLSLIVNIFVAGMFR